VGNLRVVIIVVVVVVVLVLVKAEPLYPHHNYILIGTGMHTTPVYTGLHA